MLIKYIGHSCFCITTKNGTQILIDPYDNTIGLTPVKETADILLITHNHYDHNYKEGVSGDYTQIDKVGEYSLKDVKITGIKVYHDEEQGNLRGEVVAFLIEADGMRLLHAGDIGTMPNDDFFKKVGKVDILFIPIGGTYTFNAKQALAFMDILKPNMTIPMHYLTPCLNLDIVGVHEFLERAGSEYDKSRLGISTFDITADNLKKRGRIIVLEGID